MSTIAVRVGREIKEISGLTKSTTCWDVVLALLKEKQVTSETSDSATRANENTTAGDNTNADSGSNSSKSIKEIAPSYVIVENWRGCEKPIPPRTKILNVWQAWGKEQKHVELSLKKSKHIRFRDGSNRHTRSRAGNLKSENAEVDPDHYSLHCMSSHQKKKLRRNMRRYQRALMTKQNEDCGIESVDSEVKTEPKSEKRNRPILSEEKFIDGFLADPDCLLKGPDRAHLISQGTFNREFCKYRRRNRRRHGTSNMRQHRRHQVSHYPYSSQLDKPRSSRRGRSTTSNKCRYSSDDTSTTSSVSSEDENASDADDEKSVLVDIRGNIPRRNMAFNVGSRDGYGATTTATDSSTTTSGDSMTSSVGGSTSSETSSGGDYFLPELHRLSYGRAIENAKSTKANENSSNNKPKKNKFILKPALSLIDSFRKRKTDKKSPDKQPIISDPKLKTVIPKPQNLSESKIPLQSAEGKERTPRVERNVSEAKEEPKHGSNKQDSDRTGPEHKSTVEDERLDCKDEILQSVQSQEIVLRNQRNRLKVTDDQIQSIESDIHNLRTRALGKNYVQDAYLSGYVDPNSNDAMTNLFNGPSIPVTTPWILDCNDADMLERFVQMSDKIVEMQLKIEEYNRKADMLIQDIQEEVWRSSTLGNSQNQGPNAAARAAALMLGLSDEEDVSDNENGHELLSVTSWNDHYTQNSATPDETTEERLASHSSIIEVETARTELEASLYLSLRLTAEIDEIESKLGASDHLIQKKGESLIDCVRDMAMSEEGVSPAVWEEYGELLTAYDMELSQRRFLEELEHSEIRINGSEDSMGWAEEANTLYIDATSPNPISHCGGTNHMNLNGPVREAGNALAPWISENSQVGCRYNGHVNHSPKHTVMQQHIPHYPQHPPLLSNLPLPTPINSRTTGNGGNSQQKVPSARLLPMLPIPGEIMSPGRHNDSDYEDLPDLTSMSKPDPSKSSRRLDLLVENEISNNTDDSGNASAGSTSSFASSDGSRNSSCDGGSPRPIPMIIENPSSRPIFGRNSGFRGSWKEHFVFPNTCKENGAKLNQQRSVVSLPQAMMKSKAGKPELLPKPASVTLKQATVVDSKETEIRMQQQRLIRRNSAGRKRNALENANSAQSNSKGVKLKNVSSGSIHPKGNNCQSWQLKFNATEQNQRFNNTYDNDSDTGRSSLHSVDSDQVMFSETLV